ncbi:hypothetical protein JY651_03655 [Pyxidicoccus parkwayensis]|uniref:Lipoprotein n=1 Tax=Pyxidicoccus parkwayensis TaxID=2813578 RepID=A0ABX7NYT2_9BACT|nr:hypothetical protein [Pyxidicoccus parkwaysis]QSQ24086.1 hypothetical protein JY651_03655 [Pyxidicoccus parkwaysis]
MRAAGKRRWLIALLVFAGCRGADGAVVNALLNTSLAVGASAAQRAAGGCYADCPVGTACDEVTGYCMPLPCRGRCGASERCVQTGLEERCESLAMQEGGLDVRPTPPSAKPSSTPSDAPRKDPVPSP